MNATKLSRVAIFFAVFCLTACFARADLLVLTNGDLYRGAIVSMDANNIVFQSEIQGRVVLPRAKVATMSLHQLSPKVAAAVKASTPIVAAPLVVTGTNASVVAHTPTSGSQADAVVAELRQQGIDPKLIDQVQEQIFGKSSPEAAQKFNEMMGGLMSGNVSVADIRKQAQSSIAQIQAAKKDLGGDAGEMLDGYLGILERFVQESATDNTVTSATPTPAKP